MLGSFDMHSHVASLTLIVFCYNKLTCHLFILKSCSLTRPQHTTVVVRLWALRRADESGGRRRMPPDRRQLQRSCKARGTTQVWWACEVHGMQGAVQLSCLMFLHAAWMLTALNFMELLLWIYIFSD